MLPNFLSTATDFEQIFPTLAPIMGKTLHEEKDLRLDVMRRFAYSFLRELFSLYTVSNATMEEVEGTTGNSLRTLRCSILETVRLYMDLTPCDVVDNFTNLAVEKLQIETMPLDQKIRVLDLTAALVSSASVSGLNTIFSIVHPWFLSTEMAFQKKAFRIFNEIFKRLNDKSVTEFFTSYGDEISNILEQDMSSVAKSARAAFISAYKSKLNSLSSLKSIEKFAEAYLVKIILCFDKSNNVRTRTGALGCFVQLCQRMIQCGSDKKL
ncbi:unnamed protein product [Gongylonema pulchrum]|uniref:NUC173 domain-containing protein n=1 Tax=Gongylonema pulchrum TaxID=637853 RepID=A0A3P7N7F7_9BILA|nr:unnamed protein product [Gongylonema pulchrum]